MSDRPSTSPETTLDAARTLFRAAGFNEEVIERAIEVLMGKDNGASVQEGLLSAKEVCEWLGISYTTLWRLNIPHIKLNHLRRFYRSEVKEFLDSKRRRGNYGLRR